MYKRQGLDRIDLYLLHWRGATPLAQTVQGFEQLLHRDCIRRWGVSNFDLADMQELMAVPGGAACAANQVHYSPSARGVEWDLLPWQRQQGMPLMAYSPFDQGELVNQPALQELARRHQATPAQIALAWVLGQAGVMAIPKAGRALHLQLNWAAPRLVLSPQDLADLDRSFAPPRWREMCIRDRRSGVQRVVGYLLRNQVADDSVGGEAVVSLPVSKATLASRLSLTPEYFSRVLHELEEARLISVDRRDIHILDSAALSRYP